MTSLANAVRIIRSRKGRTALVRSQGAYFAVPPNAAVAQDIRKLIGVFDRHISVEDIFAEAGEPIPVTAEYLLDPDLSLRPG